MDAKNIARKSLHIVLFMVFVICVYKPLSDTGICETASIAGLSKVSEQSSAGYVRDGIYTASEADSRKGKTAFEAGQVLFSLKANDRLTGESDSSDPSSLEDICSKYGLENAVSVFMEKGRAVRKNHGLQQSPFGNIYRAETPPGSQVSDTVEAMVIDARNSQHPTGISDYEYAVGTGPGATDILYWRTSRSQTSLTVDMTDTPLVPVQPCFLSVRARNENGYWSSIGTSDGIVYSESGYNV